MIKDIIIHMMGAAVRSGDLPVTRTPPPRWNGSARDGFRRSARPIRRRHRNSNRYHNFNATSSTEYLLNGGKLEVTQLMVDHESSRTTGIYDHRSDRVSLDEVERICI